ncbi:MAG: hypothetical protein ABII00_11615 [Elusimicrobiota bacterium]
MRYWVYQDSRILGPFGAEEIASVPGLHGDSLVCGEGALGTKEQDWQPLQSVLEPAETSLGGAEGGGAPSASLAPGVVSEAFESFQDEAHAALESIGVSEEWAAEIQRDPRLSPLWGVLPGHLRSGAQSAERETRELEARLCELKDQLESNEKRQNEILDKLNEKDRLLAEKDRALENLRARVAEIEARPPGAAGAAASAAGAAFIPGSQKGIVFPTSEAPKVADEARAENPAPAGEAAPFPESPIEGASPISDAFRAADEAATVPGPGTIDGPARPESVPELDIPDIPDIHVPEAAPERAKAPAEAAPPEGAETSPPLDTGVPEATALKSVSEMAAPLEFVPPVPDETMLPPPEAAGPMVAGEEAAGGPAVEAPLGGFPAPAAGADEAPPELEAPPMAASEEYAGPAAQAPLAGVPIPEAGEASSGPDLPGAPPSWGPTQDAATIHHPSASEPGLQAPPPLPEGGPTPDVPEFPLEPPPLPGPGEAGAVDQPAMSGSFEQPKTMLMGVPGQPPDDTSGLESLSLTPPEPEAWQTGGFGAGQPPEGVELIQGMPGQAPTPMPIPLSEPGQAQQLGLPHTILKGPEIPLTGPGRQIPFPGATPPLTGVEAGGPEAGAFPPAPGMQSFEDMLGGGAPAIQPTTATKSPVTIGGPALPSGKKGPTPALSKSKRVPPKKFLIGLGAALVGLVVVMFLFLKNPKQVVQLVDMAPETSPQEEFGTGVQGAGGVFQEDAATGLEEEPEAQSPERSPEPGLPPAAVPAAQPTQAAPPGPDYIQDQRVEAIEFVKNYFLDERRGSVGQWLQYSFLIPGSTPEWSAGAVGANVWLVEFKVFKGAQSKKPTAAYRFEVDLARKALKGLNAEAADLLRGGVSRSRRGSQGSSGGARKRTRSPRSSQGEAQLPLPDEEDLGEAGGRTAGGFNNPGADNLELRP